jgi:putative phage-type endonuclease
MNAPTRAEFLARRQAGIGGSDVAAILGLSPYKTAVDVWLSKTQPPPADDQMSEAAYWGITLEDVVAKEYARRTGAKVQRFNELLTHPSEPWMIANIDRAIVTQGRRPSVCQSTGWLQGIDGLLECKTASTFKSSEWGVDGDEEAIPTHYAAQGMWYLAVTGAPWIDFACLIGGQRFVTKRLHRDEATIDALMQRCSDFWHNHVLARNQPPASTSADLPPEDNGQAVEADEEALIAFNDAYALRQQIAGLEKQLEPLVERIKLKLGQHSELRIDGKPVLTWRQAADSTKTDWKAVASSLKAWAIEAGIDGGVDAIRDAIDQQTKTIPGARRLLFK